jgi:hypothetical protein
VKLAALPLRIAALSSAVSLCSACDDRSTVTVEVTLDPGTCSTSDPGDVSLSCNTTVGVWLVGGSGRYLDQACVDLSDGEDDLGQLRSRLADMELSTEETTTVSARAAVYAPWTSAQGCFPPDDIAQIADTPPEIVMRGSSDSRALVDADGTFEVELRCVGAQRTAAQTCHADCPVQRRECHESVATVACGEENEDCLELCDDEDELCYETCMGRYRECLSMSVDGRCWLGFLSCIDTCNGSAGCLAECEDAYYGCQNEDCIELEVQCDLGCPDPVCASFPEER